MADKPGNITPEEFDACVKPVDRVGKFIKQLSLYNKEGCH